MKFMVVLVQIVVNLFVVGVFDNNAAERLVKLTTDGGLGVVKTT